MKKIIGDRGTGELEVNGGRRENKPRMKNDQEGDIIKAIENDN